MKRIKLSFMLQFTVFFLLISFISMFIFTQIGRYSVDKFFEYYVQQIHEDTHQVMIKAILDNYADTGGWQTFDGERIAASAILLGDYFTIYDTAGNIIYTTEDNIVRCCANANHVYTQNIYPISMNGQEIGTVRTGYFSSHLFQPEEMAFRKGAKVFLILTLLVVGFVTTSVSLCFFYRMSKPFKVIAETAEYIAQGHLREPAKVESSIHEMNVLVGSIDRLRESLLRQEQHRKDLTADLSHELRTPLHTLLNQVDAMIDGIYSADEHRLQAMRGEINRITKLLNLIDRIEMYENDTFSLDREKADISKITRDVILGHENDFRLKGVILEANIDDGIICDLDSARYSQALINILTNALKFTDSNGRVTVTLKREDGNVVLKVSDTGKGIPAEHLPSIFERLYRINSNTDGAGVGLSIVKSIADKHGWKINVQSEINKGSTFRIFIPDLKL